MKSNLVALISVIIAVLTTAGIGVFSIFPQATTVTVTETLKTTLIEKEPTFFTIFSTVTETKSTTIFSLITATQTITSTEVLTETATVTETYVDTVYRTVTSLTKSIQTITKTITTFTPTTVTSISPTTITSTITHFIPTTTTETISTTTTATRAMTITQTVTTTETLPTTYTVTTTTTQTITKPINITQTVTVTSPMTVTKTIVSNVTQIVFQTATVFSCTTEAGEQVVASVSNVNIPAYSVASFSVWVDAGKTVKLSWKADNYLYVYIMTENQFKSGWIMLPSYYEAYKYGREGTISAYSCCGDKYYMVFINLNLATVKLYEAKVTTT